MSLTRRHFLETTSAVGAVAAMPAWGRSTGGTGRTAVFVLTNEPMALTNAFSTEGSAYVVSSKVFDGLLSYDAQRNPKPRLATAWQTSADGLSFTLKLRTDVRWHDGHPFTSADVAYSVMEAWKKHNSRGRATYATVERVDTPDAHTAVLRLSKPAPYLLSALSSIESQVVPKHLYAGSNPLTNPRNGAPIGTGPFRYVSRQRGSHLVLERNPDYWDKGSPKLDRLIFRVVPDRAGVTAALETGEAHMGLVPLNHVPRLRSVPHLSVTPLKEPLSVVINALEFNLDRPVLRDVRVRRALAHAIDRDFIVKSIYFGHAEATESPLPKSMSEFYTGDVPRYPLDLQRAEALLDQAGLPRNAQGVRLTLRIDPNPGAETVQIAQYLRSAFAKIGVKLEVRNQDFAEYVNRVYTRRDFDTALIGGMAGPDPAIGTQRWYWSKNFLPGVAFSNGAHYANPEVDRALESAQVEPDAAKRRALYHRFQQLVQTDLPRIPLLSPTGVLVTHRSLRNVIDSAEGVYGNFANASF